MRRLYFLIPDMGTTREIVDELLLARVDEHNMHVIAKRDTVMPDIPEATIVHMSDLMPAIWRGITYGGTVGLLAGLIVAMILEMSLDQTGGLVTLGVTLGGALFGAWISGLVGISIPNTRIRHFQQAIEEGRFLMLVDVPNARMDAIQQDVARRHPNVKFGGVEPSIPAFP